MKAKTLLPLLAVAGLLVVPATAQVNYAIAGGTAYVARSPNASGNIFIVPTYNGYRVTSIESYAFYDCIGLTSVTAPNSVTNMGVGTFFGCTSLTNVTIPNGVTSIGDSTFWRCANLASVTIGNSVTNIGSEAFSGCTSLTSVAIPESVTSIGGSAFDNCTSLTNFSVAAANPAYSSLNGVLFNQDQTTLITFPAGRGGSYVIPNSVTGIRDYAFYRSTGLKSVTILDSVTYVGFGAFLSCTALTSLTLGNSVTNIGSEAFAGCRSLTSMTIPDSVTGIGDNAFYGCRSLTDFSVGAANPAYSSLNGVLFNQEQTTLITFPAGRGGSYLIPNSVTGIGNEAFSLCTSLTSVTIPNRVTSIQSWTFYFCTNLTSVTIGNSVTNIGLEAFFACASLTSLTFLGNAPSLSGLLDTVGAGATVYYYHGTTGWGPTYGGLPTVMLFAPQIGPGSAGMKPGGFGFTLCGVTNQTIVVEVSTNLATWQPVWTNTLSGPSADFVDPRWLDHPHRFYRARSN